MFVTYLPLMFSLKFRCIGFVIASNNRNFELTTSLGQLQYLVFIHLRRLEKRALNDPTQQNCTGLFCARHRWTLRTVHIRCARLDQSCAFDCSEKGKKATTTMLASVEDPEQPRVKKEKKIKKRSKSKLPQERGSENHHSAEYATRPSPFRHSDKGSMSDDDVKKARRELRRAQKMVQRLAELGLDEHGNELDNYSLLKYPLREFKLRLSDQTAIALNPAVTLFAIVGLVAVVWWSSVIGTFFLPRAFSHDDDKERTACTMTTLTLVLLLGTAHRCICA